MSKRLTETFTDLGRQILPGIFPESFDEVEDESSLWLEYTPEMKKVLIHNDAVLLEEIFAQKDWREHLHGFRVEYVVLMSGKQGRLT